jgi:hypothetical protein
MKMIILLAGLLGYSALAQAQSVTIIGVRMTGTGCNDSTAWANTTSDGKTLSVLFDNLKVEIGNGSENPQSSMLKKNCRVLIDVEVPFGYQYGLDQTDYRGFAALPVSAYGMHRFTQIVPGQPIASAREAQLRGPIADDYAVSVKQKPGRVVYSPCGQRTQTIELLTELQVAYLPNTKDRSIAQINLDSVDTGVNSTFVMSWKKCK